jgi:hypothetical protein
MIINLHINGNEVKESICSFDEKNSEFAIVTVSEEHHEIHIQLK